MTIGQNEARAALDAALDSTERMQGDPQPTADELLNTLTAAGYAIVRTPEPDGWHQVATTLRDIVRQVQDAVHEAGLTPALIRAEATYRRLAENAATPPDPDDVKRLATYITGHPEAQPLPHHLAAVRAVLGGLAREGLPAVVGIVFGGSAEEGRTWYRALSGDGKLWCETSDPREVAQSVEDVEAVQDGQGYTLERLRCYIVRTPWEPWTPEPTTD